MEDKTAFDSQPSTLIIIAISPQYKADIQGSVVDSRSVHTRYIYAMVSYTFFKKTEIKTNSDE